MSVSASVFENGLSYLSVPGPPLSPLTLGQLLEEAAQKSPTSEYLYDAPHNLRLTYVQLKNEVDLFAGGLLKVGLNPGDRIGIWGPNSSEWIITFLAAAKVGIITVPLNVGYEAPELLYALNHVSIKCLVLAEEVKTRNFYKILNGAIPDMKISEESSDDGSPLLIRIRIPTISSIVAPHLKKIIYMGKEQLNKNEALLWTDVQQMGRDAEDLERMNTVAETVQFDDVLYVLFTSGTTGQPKAAMISHHSQINGARRIGKCCQFTPEDSHCLTLPLSHLYGISVGIFYPLSFHSSIVIPSPTFSPKTAITIAAKEKCTWLHGPPTMLSDMMNIPGFDRLDLTSLKAVTIGGAPSTKTLLADVKKKYKISKICSGYGMTEASGLARIRVEDPPDLVFTSVGYPMENTEMKIVDPGGRIVGVGETGEVCCRNCSVMLGYWEDPEKTREAIDSARWFHTGDAGYFLESGHLVLVGRFKDMLCRGGENIYPKEIEDFLHQNLSEEIEEAYAFGVADERLGEVVAAWILPKPREGVAMDTEYIKAVCEGKICRSKIPVYIKFLSSKDDFPRTSVGKVQKNVIRQQYEKELGLNKETS